MIKNIIFDYDGVLVDSFDFHLENLNRIYGINLTPKQYADIHMGNFFDDVIPELEDIDWNIYRNSIIEEQKKLEINEEVKRILHDKRYDCFIVSSGFENQIEESLKANDVRDIFNEVLGAQASKSKVEKIDFIFGKYGLEKRETLFITDTLGDILEAHEAGVKTIAVDFGFHTDDVLRKGRPHAICSSWDEVQHVIDSL